MKNMVKFWLKKINPQFFQNSHIIADNLWHIIVPFGPLTVRKEQRYPKWKWDKFQVLALNADFYHHKDQNLHQ